MRRRVRKTTCAERSRGCGFVEGTASPAAWWRMRCAYPPYAHTGCRLCCRHGVTRGCRAHKRSACAGESGRRRAPSGAVAVASLKEPRHPRLGGGCAALIRPTRTRAVGFVVGMASLAVVGRISAAHAPAGLGEAAPQAEPQTARDLDARSVAPHRHPITPPPIARPLRTDRARPMPRTAERHQAAVRLWHPPCTPNTTAMGRNGSSRMRRRKGRA